MGCVQSRKEVNDVHPNVFRVINIDEGGTGLWAGQLEVTEVELVLYRRGKEPTRWPLRSLRRYGFDGDIFSFESGRRCTTGEGIYAFKCRRAEQLFDTLKLCIQDRNAESILDAMALDGPNRPPSTLPRPPADAPRPVQLDHSDYLEPAPPPSSGPPSRFSGTVRLESVGSGPLSPEVHSPGSPSSANILEVMPLGPLPPAGAQVTNLYQLQDFYLQREHNNNRICSSDMGNHSYLNTRDISTDLATLRHSLHSRRLASFDEDGSPVRAADVIVDAPLSPTHSVVSEHYETLAVEPEADDRLYMNLAPGETPSILSAVREEALRRQPVAKIVRPKPNNFVIADLAEVELEEDRQHEYVNLGPGDVNYDSRLLIRRSASGGFAQTPGSPTGLHELPQIMNYAVLDLDEEKAEAEGESQAAPAPATIPATTTAGYTTIDFRKTGVLTSMSQCTEMDTEGSRKTRHNSTALPSGPAVT